MAAESPEDAGATRQPDVGHAVELAIRLGALALVVGWCLMILAPFLGIVVWALIIAIAAEDACRKLADTLGGRRGLAASLLVLLALATLIVPAVLLSETLVEGAQYFAENLEEGSLKVPPPSEQVAGWPLVGKPLYDFWLLASQNLEAALTRLAPQLQAVSGWLLGAAAAGGVALLQLTASFVLAGFLMVHGQARHDGVARFATRLVGTRGPDFARLATATVKSVVQGILGVAAIQTLLAGLAFGLLGVPAAGLWALLVLVAAVVQLPVAIVMVPPILYAFSEASAAVAVIFTVWCVGVALLDNVLKPLLFGRGVEVPTLVIFLGAIGGMFTMGFIGLFLGAVVLALGYELFVGWLNEDEAEAQPV